MKQIKKIVLGRLIAAIVFSILFVVGILFLVFGLSKHISALLIIGLFIIFLDLYLLPLLWFNFVAWCFYKKLYEEIIATNTITTLELATKLNKKDKDITKGVNVLFENSLMDEYRFVNQYKLVKK